MFQTMIGIENAARIAMGHGMTAEAPPVLRGGRLLRLAGAVLLISAAAAAASVLIG